MTYWSILQNNIEYFVIFFHHKIYISTNCVSLNIVQSQLLPYNNLYMYTPCLFRIFLHYQFPNTVATLLCNILADVSYSHLLCFILTVYHRVNNIDSGNKIHLLSVISPSVCRTTETTAGVHNPDTPQLRAIHSP